MNNVEREVPAPKNQLKKTIGVVDQSITAHSMLKERFGLQARVLDIALFLVSSFLTFLAVASHSVRGKVLPQWIDGEMTLPVVAVIVFCGSLLQWHMGWKEKAALHSEAAKVLSQFKHELAKILGSGRDVSEEELRVHLQNYQYINQSKIVVPEEKFLSLKKAHKEKVAISKLLDMRPGAWVWLVKLKLLLRDNFGVDLLHAKEDEDGPGERRKGGRNISSK